jgi:hypothetical protein
MNIICFLTVKPTKIFYDFCKKLKTNEYDIYICIDINEYNIPEYDNEIKIIKFDRKECEDNGFKSTVLKFNNIACSRDKALYYFYKEKIDFNYIWFIEEDVFIPNINTISNIDKKYPNVDLLCEANKTIYKKQKNWLWKHVNEQIKIDPPYSSSMICAIRCNKKLLNYIYDYAEKFNNLFLDEVLFTTLALQNKLTIINPIELSTIVWRKKWRLEEIICDNLYHPIKDINTQIKYREILSKLEKT